MAIDQYNQRIAQLEQQIAQLNLASSAAPGKDETIKRLQDEIAQWKQKYEALANLYAQLRKEHLDLLTKFKQIKDAGNKATDEVRRETDRVKAELKAKTNELTEVLVERNRLKDDTDRIRLQYEEELARMRREISENKAALNDMSSSKGAEVQNLVSRFTAEQTQLENIIRSKQAEAEEMRRRLDDLLITIERNKAMGLGKTAQVISFIANLFSMGNRGPHLIIVPSSTIDNWIREFTNWCPKLRVRTYRGSQSERMEQQEYIQSDSRINVIVTTYNIATGGKDDRAFLRKIPIASLILDEGHMVKNIESVRYKHLMAIKSPFRLLLTGTPLQNNLLELLALLSFIMPKLFITDRKILERIFQFKTSRIANESELNRKRIERAKRIMTPFVLRRRKDQVLYDLPRKQHVIEICKPLEMQRSMLQNVLMQSRSTVLAESINPSLPTPPQSSGDEGTKSVAVAESKAPSKKAFTNVLMDLRKISNHPLLIRSIYTPETLRSMAKLIRKEPEHAKGNLEYIWEDMMVMSDFELHQLCVKYPSIRSFALNDDQIMASSKVHKLKELLPQMKQNGDRVLLFSQFVIMLDILEVVLQQLGIRFLRMDGGTPVVERQNLIDQYSTDPSIDVFLLSTKAGGFGINLTAANVVILYDIDFNPHNDAQAEDRAHRVGQKRDVTVYRLIVDKSVEQHMWNCAQAKLNLDAKLQAQDRQMGGSRQRSTLTTGSGDAGPLSSRDDMDDAGEGDSIASGSSSHAGDAIAKAGKGKRSVGDADQDGSDEKVDASILEQLRAALIADMQKA
eukprot:jgi/Hompol1/1987/HPOL_001721-RA